MQQYFITSKVQVFTQAVYLSCYILTDSVFHAIK